MSTSDLSAKLIELVGLREAIHAVDLESVPHDARWHERYQQAVDDYEHRKAELLPLLVAERGAFVQLLCRAGLLFARYTDAHWGDNTPYVEFVLSGVEFGSAVLLTSREIRSRSSKLPAGLEPNTS